MTIPDEKDRLLDHEYDGIQEYDNPMPRWWVWSFWATIVFAVVYALDIPPIGSGPGRIAQYEQDIAAFRAAHPQGSGGMSDASLAALMQDHEAVERGGKTFAQNCAACHRADGGGLIGPNLTDGFWLHGGRPAEILRTVTEGVTAKGMPAWGKLLKQEQLTAVAAYVATLRARPAAGGKAPEGTPVAAPAAGAD